MQQRIFFGMLCSVASTILTNVGILMQKHSAHIERHLCLIYRWRFWVGFTLNLGSEVGLTSTALYLAPLSFIAPLAGLAVVFNAMISRLGIVAGTKETMSYNEWCVQSPEPPGLSRTHLARSALTSSTLFARACHGAPRPAPPRPPVVVSLSPMALLVRSVASTGLRHSSSSAESHSSPYPGRAAAAARACR